MITSFHDLDVYKESYALAIIINKIIEKLPQSEKYDLSSQMRRASKSIPANIAEGWAKRRFPKEFQHYLDVAIGSANEMEVHVSLAKDFQYLNAEDCNGLIQRYVYLGGKLVKLRNNWRTF
jgi:four helix bundle protein